ncbi:MULTISPECIES: BON domain-containing protein [Massilia]|jgi:osmotically-inducible protein OsmY|uniref:Osmotically-inducible protein Y n=2 Tax=Massilia TaxID=149698 RepID=A0A7X3FVW2_9BURK|nr:MULTISPECIES: BON domain-containing protein [Telluria group]MCS0614223.1 BON domain-containing protein [Massilia kyonggiensis]MDN4043966.1 BON domain-containing protein [Massilia sp. YIM B02787]KQY00234.1 transporter [Massilia sp. Root133]KQZ39055.1 transporter [Massilia sp. Root1485]MVW58840.1 BON domain-containing protein [Telluria cellulosilytica]
MKLTRFQSAIAQSVLATSLLVSLAACAPTPTREGTGEYIDDSVITGKVKAAFAADPTVKATQVQVETFKGTVQLSGFVDSRESAQKAVEIARGVKGVKSVKNDTVIR